MSEIMFLPYQERTAEELRASGMDETDIAAATHQGVRLEDLSTDELIQLRALYEQTQGLQAWVLLTLALGLEPTAHPSAVEAELGRRSVAAEEPSEWLVACNYDLPCFQNLMTTRLAVVLPEHVAALREAEQHAHELEAYATLCQALGLPTASPAADVEAALATRGLTLAEATDWLVVCDYDVWCFRQTMNDEIGRADLRRRNRQAGLIATLGVGVTAALGWLYWRRR